MAKVTGIGGVFFKSKGDHTALAAWYREHLGMALEDFGGAVLKWPDDKADDQGLTVWHVANKDSQWFSPSSSSFMINYRVDDLDGLLAQRNRCTSPRSRRGESQSPRCTDAWTPRRQSVVVSSSAARGGGTVTCPRGRASSVASSRPRVSAQYRGASSRYRARGQYAMTRRTSAR